MGTENREIETRKEFFQRRFKELGWEYWEKNNPNIWNGPSVISWGWIKTNQSSYTVPARDGSPDWNKDLILVNKEYEELK